VQSAISFGSIAMSRVEDCRTRAVFGQDVAGDFVEVGGGTSRRGGPDDRSKDLGHDRARLGHGSDLGFARSFDHQPVWLGSRVTRVTRSAHTRTKVLFNSWDLRYRDGQQADRCKPHRRLQMAVKAAKTRTIRRWRKNMDVLDDTAYVDTLTTLSEGSVRRNFNPYTDIDWDSPEFAVIPNDERWILPSTEPIGRHAWYKSQSKERQIEIGMWRQANVAKVGLHFESILIRGLMEYAFWTPNGSPEYRYCLHEAVEECNHTLMFQEMVNHIGADVPGMPRLLKWVQPIIPLVAGPLPIPFWFGILAGEEPIDHTQKNVLREGKTLHPIMERVMAIHVAEEARHISFAHEYLRKRVPNLPRRKRFWLSLYVPLVMRILCSAIIVPPRAFWKEFDIPRSVRKEIFFKSPESRRMLRDMFGDVRMLCKDTGLMNPLAKLIWRMCRIDGEPSRYRSEPQRQHLVTVA
jgi:hypothetical protein